jgi:3,4-dihydroxy 2-butanone 4-phosphate synthase/GTP cyclohydrolase II
LITLGIRWTEKKPSEWLDQLREVATSNNLLMQEETSMALASLFANADTQDATLPDVEPKFSIVHLGFDRSNQISDDWYEQPNHAYRQEIVRLFKHLKQWEQIKTFKFCIATNNGDLPENFAETINLGLAWNTPWKGDRLYEWFNFFDRDGDDLAILDK